MGLEEWLRSHQEEESERTISDKGYKRQKMPKSAPSPLSTSPHPPDTLRMFLGSLALQARSLTVLCTKGHPFCRPVPPSWPWFLLLDKWQSIENAFITEFCNGVRSKWLQHFNLESQGQTTFSLHEERSPKHELLLHSRRGRQAYCVQCHRRSQDN